MLDWLTSPDAWIALATLTALEIVLGIDNIVFISILTGRLPQADQPKARTLGLGFALVTRLLLLFSLTWVMGLTEPLFTVGPQAVSGRDLILLLGGLFLLAKSTREIHHSLEGEKGSESDRVQATFVAVVVQVGLLDIVFSLDSVITAVGMAEHLGVMVAAVVIAMAVMLAAAERIASFVERHPTVKMLALSFLVLIGVVLVADGLHHHVPKGYVYFSMAFAFSVELLNIRARGNAREPVQLRARVAQGPAPGPGSGRVGP